MLWRLEFVLDHVRLDGKFSEMYDTVHIDEKFFYIDKVNKSFILAPGEEIPHRTCKNKRFILTIMFAAAVARPRFNTAKNQWFTGLLGIWPFCKQVRAQRSSRNRAAGTLDNDTIS